MKNFAKLLMVPVAFVGLSSFSAAAASYTLDADPINYAGGIAKDTTVYAPLKNSAYVDGDFVAAKGDLKAYITGKVIEKTAAVEAVYCTEADLQHTSSTSPCYGTTFVNSARPETPAADTVYNNDVKVAAAAATYAIDITAINLDKDTNDSAVLTIKSGSKIEVTKLTAGVDTHVVINGTLKGDIETAGSYKVVGGVYNEDTYKVTLANPVGKPAFSKKAEVKDGAVTLEWNEVYGADVYMIRRSEKTGVSSCSTTYTTLSSSITKTTYTDNTAKAGKSYCYFVAAKRTGKTASDYSDADFVKGVASLTVEAPTKLTKEVTYKNVKLTSAKVANATGYLFFRTESLANTQNWTLVKATTSNTFTDDTVVAGHVYYYTVAAYVKSGEATYVYSDSLEEVIASADLATAEAATAANVVIAHGDLNEDKVVKANPKLAKAKISSVTNTSTLGKVKVTLTKVDGANGYVVFLNGKYFCDTTSTTCSPETKLVIGANNIFVAVAYRGNKPAFAAAEQLLTAVDEDLYQISAEVEHVVAPEAPKLTKANVKYLTVENGDPDTETPTLTKAVPAEALYSNTLKVIVTDYAEKITNGEELSYVLYKATSKNGTYKKVDEQTGAKANIFYVSDLKPGKTYYFKAKVRVNSKLSAYTSVQSKTVKMSPFGKNTDLVKKLTALNNDGAVAPATPVYFNRAINLTMTKVEGATGYVVYRATSKSGKYTAVKTILTSNLEGGDTFEWKNTKLTAGKKYYYKVRAYKTVNSKKVFGEYSSIVSATAKLVAPEDFTVEDEAKTSFKLSWSKVSGATGYRVYTTDGELLGSTTKTSITIKGLDKNTGYSVYVKAYSTVNGKKKMGIQSEVQNPHTTAE